MPWRACSPRDVGPCSRLEPQREAGPAPSAGRALVRVTCRPPGVMCQHREKLGPGCACSGVRITGRGEPVPRSQPRLPAGLSGSDLTLTLTLTLVMDLGACLGALSGPAQFSDPPPPPGPPRAPRALLSSGSPCAE